MNPQLGSTEYRAESTTSAGTSFRRRIRNWLKMGLLSAALFQAVSAIPCAPTQANAAPQISNQTSSRNRVEQPTVETATYQQPTGNASQVPGNDAATPAPFATNQREFEIPIEIDRTHIQFIREYQLLYSHDRGLNWHHYQSRKPEDEVFQFRAAGDGEYWFAMRTIDRNGIARPSGQPAQAELMVAIDTTEPELTFHPFLGQNADSVILRWNATDAHLAGSSFQIYYREASGIFQRGGEWKELRVGSANKVSLDSCSGEFNWTPDLDATTIELKAEVYDSANNVISATRKVEIPKVAKQLRNHRGPTTEGEQSANRETNIPSNPLSNRPLANNDSRSGIPATQVGTNSTSNGQAAAGNTNRQGGYLPNANPTTGSTNLTDRGTDNRSNDVWNSQSAEGQRPYGPSSQSQTSQVQGSDSQGYQSAAQRLANGPTPQQINGPINTHLPGGPAQQTAQASTLPDNSPLIPNQNANVNQVASNPATPVAPTGQGNNPAQNAAPLRDPGQVNQGTPNQIASNQSSLNQSVPSQLASQQNSGYPNTGASAPGTRNTQQTNNQFSNESFQPSDNSLPSELPQINPATGQGSDANLATNESLQRPPAQSANSLSMPSENELRQPTTTELSNQPETHTTRIGSTDSSDGNPTPDSHSNAAGNQPNSTVTSDGTQKGLPIGEYALLTNRRTFRLSYEVDSVRTDSVATVELFMTRDGGNNWESGGYDPDKRSPFEVHIPNEGIYGFKIVVTSTEGFSGKAPQPGDLADIWVEVDSTRPEGRIISAPIGQGSQAGRLLIQWQAQDRKLATRPITLYYSDTLEGPWSVIAAGLENTGTYSWKVDARIPKRLFLRLEIRDQAGNITVNDLTTPVDLRRLSPAARIKGFDDSEPAPIHGAGLRMPFRSIR